MSTYKATTKSVHIKTVGDLREMLRGLSDDMPVKRGLNDGLTINLMQRETPSGGPDNRFPLFLHVDDYDPFG